MHENRETSCAPAGTAGRSEKANSRTADTHAREESDLFVGRGCSTDEAAEQRGPCPGGGGGGKIADQGERRAISHESDPERGTSVPGVERRAPRGAGQETGAVQQSAPSDHWAAAGQL